MLEGHQNVHIRGTEKSIKKKNQPSGFQNMPGRASKITRRRIINVKKENDDDM